MALMLGKRWDRQTVGQTSDHSLTLFAADVSSIMKLMETKTVLSENWIITFMDVSWHVIL